MPADSKEERSKRFSDKGEFLTHEKLAPGVAELLRRNLEKAKKERAKKTGKDEKSEALTRTPLCLAD